jgi:hypothetical protein
MDKEDVIRERAFQIWIEEGQPDGKDKEHWERATKETGNWPSLVDNGEGKPPTVGRVY